MSSSTASRRSEETLPRMVHQIDIRTTPERLFQALTDGELSKRYYVNTAVESTWQPGAPYVYRDERGGAMLSGEVSISIRRAVW